MASKIVSGGTAHQLPTDLKKALLADSTALELWQGITSLSRNEFVCWVEDAKQAKTRERRIKRTIEELLDGQKRPCCWIGCVHRTDKIPSKSQKGILKL